MRANERYHSGIDILKVLAAIAVVYLHTVGQTGLAWTSPPTRFAVPFFAASAAYFAFRSAIKRVELNTAVYVRSRISRIYIPFLIWTAVYLLVRVTWSMSRQLPLPEAGVDLLWTGSTHHLWFLPFILVVTVVAFIVARSLRSRRSLLAGACVFALGGAIHCYFVIYIKQPMDHTVALSSHNVPVVLWTFALLCLAEAGIGERLPVRTIGRFAPPAFLIALILLALLGRNVLLENLSGLIALGAGLSLKTSDRISALKTIAGFAYGVYLCHILFVEGGQDVARLAGLGRGAFVTTCVFVLALLSSLGLCRLLALLPCAEALGVPPVRTER